MMTEEEKKNAMRRRGLGRIAVGIVGCVPGVGQMVGGPAMSIALLGAAVGTAARLVAWPLGFKKMESFGRNLQDRSIKLGFTGLALATAPYGGVALIVEGAYNVKKGDIAPYGFGAISRKVSRWTSGIAQFGDHDYQPKFWMQEKHQKTPDVSPAAKSIDSTQRASSSPVQASAPVKKEQEVEYTRVGDIVPRGKEYFATYVPAKYKDDPAKCPPAEMIVQKFNSKGDLISQGSGKSQSEKIHQSLAELESASERASSLSSVGLASRTTSRDSIRSSL